jgi:uncharacterized membrane protein
MRHLPLARWTTPIYARPMLANLSHTSQQCPECGHQLSMFNDSEITKAEGLAIGLADHVASWRFVLTVVAAIAIWVAVNLAWRPFEPYPVIIFAVISAVLASLAGLQGPLILLTQRRSAERDRQRDHEVLMVAANSEADVHRIEDKVDRLMTKLDGGGQPD